MVETFIYKVFVRRRMPMYTQYSDGSAACHWLIYIKQSFSLRLALTSYTRER